MSKGSRMTNVGPSFWGHERVHLPGSAQDDDLRLQAAAEGKRTPMMAECLGCMINCPADNQMNNSDVSQRPIMVVIVGLGPTGATLSFWPDTGWMCSFWSAKSRSIPCRGPCISTMRRCDLPVNQLAEGIGRDARDVGTKLVDRDQKLLLDWPRPQKWPAWMVSKLPIPSARPGSGTESWHCRLQDCDFASRRLGDGSD